MAMPQKTPQTLKAGYRYALMHFLGGVCLMAGIVAHYQLNGTTELMAYTVSLQDWERLLSFDLQAMAAWMILSGLLINAAAPPFSAWLPDAYPEASPTGAVFLSAFTTKTSVFVLLTLFAGTELLIYIGLFMVFYGIIYAMLENNMRRILSYSIINQVGFMVTGTGIGTPLAQLGVASHAFCHIIYKALLLMSAGAVVHMTGRHKCSDVGGLYRTMRLTMVCGVIGALSISAFPLTSGFVSKSMISAAAADQHLAMVWFLLAAASAGVFLHAGIKFPWFVFFQKDSGLRPNDPPGNMQLAMVLMALLCLIPGIYPDWLYRMLPMEVAYVPYTASHVVTQLQLLLFAGLAFFVALPWLKRTLTISLDFDWFYRELASTLLCLLERFVFTLYDGVCHVGELFYRRFRLFIYSWHGPEGLLARNWALGSTVLFATSMLGLFLILYYLSS